MACRSSTIPTSFYCAERRLAKRGAARSTAAMCNLYTMTATVDELRRLYGSFDGDREKFTPFNEIYPGTPGAGVASFRKPFRP